MKRRKFKTSEKFLAIKPEAMGEDYPKADGNECPTIEGVTVIHISGPLTHHPCGYFDSYDEISARFAAACEDNETRAILLNFDSPGGEAAGMYEATRAMRAMKVEAKKSVYAYSNEACFSAAYGLATIADEIYMPESAGVGSVGCLAVMCDRVAQNKMMGLNVKVLKSGPKKADGHPDVALDDAVLERTQDRVDDLANQFFDLVAESRPVTVATLRGYEAGVFFGQGAVDAGLADGIMSLEELIASASSLVDVPKSQSVKSPQPGDTKTMNLALLKKRVTDAKAALASAKTSEAKKRANLALSTAQSALSASTKKVKHTKETHEEEETDAEDESAEDAEEEEESAEDAEEESDDSDDKDDGDDGDSDDDDSDKEDEEEEAESKKMKKGEAESLAKFAIKLTGAKSAAGARGALQAYAESHKAYAKVAPRLAKVEGTIKRDRVSKMVRAAISEGKLKPSQKDWATNTGLKSINTLKGYLDTATAMPNESREPMPLEFGSKTMAAPSAFGGPPVAIPAGLSAEDVQIATGLGVPLEQFAKRKAERNGSSLKQ